MSSPIYVTGKTKATSRISKDTYNTPFEVVKATVYNLFQDYGKQEIKTVLDYGCGNGIWGRCVRDFLPQARVVGFDIQDFTKEHNFYSAYDEILINDDESFLKYNTEAFDLIVGNPPYVNLKKHTKSFWNLIKQDGLLAWLLPLQYLQGQARSRMNRTYLDTAYVYVNRIKWFGKSPHGQHAFFVYKKWSHIHTKETELKFLTW